VCLVVVQYMSVKYLKLLKCKEIVFTMERGLNEDVHMILNAPHNLSLDLSICTLNKLYIMITSFLARHGHIKNFYALSIGILVIYLCIHLFYFNACCRSLLLWPKTRNSDLHSSYFRKLHKIHTNIKIYEKISRALLPICVLI